MWRGKGAEALVVGQVVALPDGRFEVRFRLLDAVKQTQLAGYSYTISAGQWRATAHQIADIIYEKLTGTRGAFGSRIAYVQKQGKRYELQVADADGQNPRTVVRSGEPLISPVFSPDGASLVYVSFEDKKPVVYVQSLRDGGRRKAAAFKGSNSAPAWTPDGKRLAVVLTRDEASQIYLINADGSGLNRLTRGGNIDTEPVFSPDGQTRVFHFGSRRQPADLSRGGQRRRTQTADLQRQLQRVADDQSGWPFSGLYWAGRRTLPGGAAGTGQWPDPRADRQRPRRIAQLCARMARRCCMPPCRADEGVLGTVSLDGKTRARLSESGVDAREPDWGP